MGNGFQLVRLEEAGAVGFKREMQKAFQYGYEVEFGPCAEVILPEEDIDRSLNAPGAVAYVAMVEGVPSGGAVVKIDPEGRRNHLELLFVKVGTQSRGWGRRSGARSRNFIPTRRCGRLALPTSRSGISISTSTAAVFMSWSSSIRVIALRRNRGSRRGAAAACQRKRAAISSGLKNR